MEVAGARSVEAIRKGVAAKQRIAELRIARAADVAAACRILCDGDELFAPIDRIREAVGIDLVDESQLHDVAEARAQGWPRIRIDDPARARRHFRGCLEPDERAHTLRLTIDPRLARNRSGCAEDQPPLLAREEDRSAQHALVRSDLGDRKELLIGRQAGTGNRRNRLQREKHRHQRQGGEPARRSERLLMWTQMTRCGLDFCVHGHDVLFSSQAFSSQVSDAHSARCGFPLRRRQLAPNFTTTILPRSSGWQ